MLRFARLATFLFIPLAAFAQWVHLSGPVPPPASELAVHEGRWFLGTDIADAGDLFVSEDGGRTWSDVGLPNGGVSALLSHDGVLFVGVYLGGLKRSVDGGASWTDHLQEGGATVEALLPLGGDSLLAGLDPFFPAPLQLSVDGGQSWAPLANGPSLRCYDLARVGGALLAGGEDAGVWRSTDGGQSWNPASTGLPADADVQRFVVEGETVWTAAESVFSPLEIFRSDDAGLSWTQVSVDLPAPRGDEAGHFSRQGDELWLGVNGTFGTRGLLRSSDDGAHWTLASAGVPDHPGVRAAARIDGELVVGTPDGVFRSGDDGATWQPSWSGAAGIGGGRAVIHAFGRLHASVETFASLENGIHSSADGGLSWSTPTMAPDNTTATGFAVDGGLLYAALDGTARGVAVSEDGGANFTALNPEWTPFSTPLCVFARDSLVLCGAWEGLHRSEDGGVNWDYDGSLGSVRALAALGDTLFAALYPGGVRRSLDGGLSWLPVDAGLDGTEHINALAVHDGTVYAARNLGTVVRWTGAGWVDAGLDDRFVYALVSTGPTLVAGSATAGLFLLDASGDWTDISDGFTGQIVEAACLGPDRVYVSTRHRGLWARPIAELDGSVSVAEREPAPRLELAAFPNPFNPTTRLAFVLPQAGPVEVAVHDLLGRRVRTLLQGERAAGRHALNWDGHDDGGRESASGLYFVRVVSAGGVGVTKLTLLR